MSYNPDIFSVQVGDKIPLRHKPDHCNLTHLVVTEVFHNTEYCAHGFVACGEIVFDIDGSLWGGDESKDGYQRETVAGWDYPDATEFADD